jgi:hypothetical protein
VQLPELVHDGGLSSAADLPAGALSVLRVPHRDLTASQPWTMPVAFGVTTGTPVFNGDPVLTAPAPRGYGDRLAQGGDYGGDYGHAYWGTSRPAETIKSQVRGTSAQVATGQ